MNTSTASPVQAASLANQPIDITQQDSLAFWQNKLDCSEEELRVAVADVGPLAGDVGDQLGRPL
jgi:predicted secreted protein